MNNVRLPCKILTYSFLLLGMYFLMYVPGMQNIKKTLNTSVDTFLFELTTV